MSSWVENVKPYGLRSFLEEGKKTLNIEHIGKDVVCVKLIDHSQVSNSRMHVETNKLIKYLEHVVAILKS